MTKLKNLIEDSFSGKHPDEILLCETWHSKNSPVPEVDGYYIVHKHREHKKGIGVTILVSEQINSRHRSDLDCNTNIFEHCIVELKLK